MFARSISLGGGEGMGRQVATISRLFVIGVVTFMAVLRALDQSFRVLQL